MAHCEDTGNEYNLLYYTKMRVTSRVSWSETVVDEVHSRSYLRGAEEPIAVREGEGERMIL